MGVCAYLLVTGAAFEEALTKVRLPWRGTALARSQAIELLARSAKAESWLLADHKAGPAELVRLFVQPVVEGVLANHAVHQAAAVHQAEVVNARTGAVPGDQAAGARRGGRHVAIC